MKKGKRKGNEGPEEIKLHTTQEDQISVVGTVHGAGDEEGQVAGLLAVEGLLGLVLSTAGELQGYAEVGTVQGFTMAIVARTWNSVH